ncbi:hypothetical protein [Bacillus thuringiensis]|uniref:hypothetical protein n=1 Tax=Bacillus thuringiensis TaxID=1428 RepID=UPI0015CF0FB6|nr:hypothetical protein [Bacillus thuringiensis]
MKGSYFYDSHEGKWKWKVECMGVEVDSGKCENSQEMDEVRKRLAIVHWNKY